MDPSHSGPSKSPGPPTPFDSVFASVFDDLSEGLQVVDFDWRYLYLNRAAIAHSRQSPESLLGHRMTEAYPGFDRTEVFAVLSRCMTSRTRQHLRNEFTYPDGARAWFDIRVDPVPQGILIYSVDVTRQQEIEDRLRRSEEDLAATLDCMADGVLATDAQGRVTRMNPAASALTGWAAAEAIGQPLDALVRFLNERTREPTENTVGSILRTGATMGLANHTVLLRRDGTEIAIASSGAPIRDSHGEIRGVVIAIRDMSEEYELTAMLHHAQKMEAVGRLAGGVAHDFNNLLTVITGYCDVLMFDTEAQGRSLPELAEIRTAAERAAMLTRHLLAFSRKQVLQPRILDPNEAIVSMEGMIRRLIGEDVEFSVQLTPGIGHIWFDPGQIEQIVMNLTVNARDAMPTGGRLVIRTEEVELDEEYAAMHAGVQPGPHVMISVADNGVGMEEEAKTRMFEPYFTTKGPGKGTGLGLSTVYGIVRQSGGTIWVYSEPGKGTTIKVYIPRATESTASPVAPPKRASVPGGSETILLVEDDAAVRGLLRRILARGGYSVLEASDGDMALALSESYSETIHLLLTDVILPGTGGRELAGQLAALRPDLRIAFMSGYSDEAIARHGILDPGAWFLEKPISVDVLLTKLREILA